MEALDLVVIFCKKTTFKHPNYLEGLDAGDWMVYSIYFIFLRIYICIYINIYMYTYIYCLFWNNGRDVHFCLNACFLRPGSRNGWLKIEFIAYDRTMPSGYFALKPFWIYYVTFFSIMLLIQIYLFVVGVFWEIFWH